MTTKDTETPLYYGHRARLRERFMVDEGASMPDYEMLELLLTMAIPRRDVKPLAKKLIAHYGDLGKVLHAPAHDLLDSCNLSQNAIVLLRLVASCALRSYYLGFAGSDEVIFSSWVDFQSYCWDKMGHKEVEELRMFMFDDNSVYKGEKLLSSGTINRTSFYPRDIIKYTLDAKATSIVLAHNHPSGDQRPSEADKALTKKIIDLSEVMGFEVLDHLIVSPNGVFSFREAGLIACKNNDKNNL